MANQIKSTFYQYIVEMSIILWVGSFYISIILSLSATFLPIFYPSKESFTLLIFVVFLMIIPVDIKLPNFLENFFQDSFSNIVKYFQLKVIVEDEQSLQNKGPFIIGFEPHSCLAIGIPIVFGNLTNLLPDCFSPRHPLASSACFVVPIVRHLFWAIGIRPVTKRQIYECLDNNISVILNPGGVKEIHKLQDGKEVILLKERKGFVRIAMKKGIPIVPVFAFGQTDAYKCKQITSPPFPKYIVEANNKLSRWLGVGILIFYGRYYTSLPFKSKMTVVIGKAIDVRKEEEIEEEKVMEYLNKFIEEMTKMYEKYKKESGYEERELIVL